MIEDKAIEALYPVITYIPTFALSPRLCEAPFRAADARATRAKSRCGSSPACTS